MKMLITLSDLLKEKGIECDVVCVRNYDFYHNSSVKGISCICRMARYKNSFSNGYFKKCYISFIDKIAFKYLLKQYDKVDLHSYCDVIVQWSSLCHKWGVCYDITLWGSDVLRATDAELYDREEGFRHAHSIRGIKSLLSRLSLVFNGRYDEKMKEVYFGNSNYETIDALSNDKSKEIAVRLGVKKNNKLTVTCGYNGLRAQQHSIMLSAIDKLPLSDKEKIHLVIPMSYASIDSYKEQVLQQLSVMGISFSIIDKFLTIEELASLRKQTDIAINMQTTDAFCAALKEHIYCGNVVVIGDWLDYPIYDSNNIFYIKSSLSHLCETIKQTIDNFDEIKVHTTGNRIKLLKCTSWQAVLDGWVNAMKM
ncbi:MAG: hypothetical protein E7070_00305 [Bacteroidales bacterium]|jgi:hypothetical protein|nr:hypothetical protein [Bacteroidales bacterium]